MNDFDEQKMAGAWLGMMDALAKFNTACNGFARAASETGFLLTNHDFSELESIKNINQNK